MSAYKVHYKGMYDHYTICGMMVSNNNLTDVGDVNFSHTTEDLSKVTCGNCKRTDIYKTIIKLNSEDKEEKPREKVHKMHLVNNNTDKTACGWPIVEKGNIYEDYYNATSVKDTTKDVSKVTCNICKRTQYYKKKLGGGLIIKDLKSKDIKKVIIEDKEKSKETSKTKETELPIKKFDKTSTLNVKIKITKQFKVRMWIVKQLLKLTGFVLGCCCEVKYMLEETKK